MIWDEPDYQSMLQEQMENEAREWFKKNRKKINGNIKSETVIV